LNSYISSFKFIAVACCSAIVIWLPFEINARIKGSPPIPLLEDRLETFAGILGNIENNKLKKNESSVVFVGDSHTEYNLWEKELKHGFESSKFLQSHTSSLSKDVKYIFFNLGAGGLTSVDTMEILHKINYRPDIMIVEYWASDLGRKNINVIYKNYFSSIYKNTLESGNKAIMKLDILKSFKLQSITNFFWSASRNNRVNSIADFICIPGQIFLNITHRKDENNYITSVNTEKNGFVQFETSKNNNDEDPVLGRIDEFFEIKKNNAHNYIDRFFELINDFHIKGTKIVIVRYPVVDKIISYEGKHMQFFFNRILKKCKVMDFSVIDYYDDRYNAYHSPERFWDRSDHLKPEYGKQFSEVLGMDLYKAIGEK
jgi:hypothetical protein